MTTNPNDPAYPITVKDDKGYDVQVPGLTKREYFAAMVLQGMIASGGSNFEDAVYCADALINALNKEQ